MAPSGQLLKKQSKNPEEIMKELASEAAIVVSSRMNKTKKEEVIPQQPKTLKEEEKREEIITVTEILPSKTIPTRKGAERNSSNTLLNDEYYSLIEGTVA